VVSHWRFSSILLHAAWAVCGSLRIAGGFHEWVTTGRGRHETFVTVSMGLRERGMSYRGRELLT
jgi:hypothetical protein